MVSIILFFSVFLIVLKGGHRNQGGPGKAPAGCARGCIRGGGAVHQPGQVIIMIDWHRWGQLVLYETQAEQALGGVPAGASHGEGMLRQHWVGCHGDPLGGESQSLM